MQTVAPSLLEREHELEEIARLVDEACGGRGRTVLIEGPGGIGKTRLLEAARARARDQGMLVLGARPSELERDFPFGVVRQLFEPVIVAAEAPRLARLLEGAAGRAAPLVGGVGRDADTPSDEVDSALVRFHSLYWLTANLAEEVPLALVVDDAQWADASSLRFLQFLLPRLDELPVLVAVGARPAKRGSERQTIDTIATDAMTTVLRPAPLSDRAVAALISDELGDASDPRFSDACRKATGGNPFLLRELLRELAVEGISPSADGAPLVRQLAPPAVARAVVLRLARLGDDASALARAVAVLGDGVPLRRACVLAELSDEQGGELAEALANADILSAARPLAFAHPILRAAIYADIPPAERARAHRGAASLLASEGAEADAIALHLLATEPAGDPYVVATLRAAAERARTRGAAPVAAVCLRRALDEPPDIAERGGLALDLASAEVRAGDPAAAVEWFEEAGRLVTDPHVRAAYAAERKLAFQAVGRADEVFGLVERDVEELAARDPDGALSMEADLIASASLDRSRRAWARRRLERHRGRMDAATSGAWRLLATQAHIDAFSGRSDAPAASLAAAAERALELRDLLGEAVMAQSTPFFFAITALVLADRTAPARAALDRGMERARRLGSAPGFAVASGWRCWVLARDGVLVEAEADARSCADASLEQGWFGAAPPMLGYVLEVLIERGELDDAEAFLDASGLTERLDEEDVTFDGVVHARARLRAARGDLAGARADLSRFAQRRARWNTYPTHVPGVLIARELLGDDPAAERARAERMLREARVWDTPRAVGMALRAAGLVEGGERRIELLAEAAEVLADAPARLERARALTDLGAALRQANRRIAAREPLRLALDLADACGARPLAERARQELRAAGGRPRRPRTSGVEALTASERRIAAMAARGMSNPEIAQALFVTKKTVEAHLGGAYRKLGIRSRTQLAGALEEGGER